MELNSLRTERIISKLARQQATPDQASINAQSQAISFP